MNIIVFDTETTGMPQPGQPLEKQPYVCQFAAIIYQYDSHTRKFEEKKRVDQLIKPAISIPEDCVRVHGITDQKVASSPSFSQFAQTMIDLFKESDLAVAHNLSFDIAVLESELERAGKSKNFLPANIYDSMKETKELCRLPGKNGNYKSPRLTELHQFLLGSAFENAHNAMADVEALGRCVKKLIQNGFYVPPQVSSYSAPALEQSSLF